MKRIFASLCIAVLFLSTNVLAHNDNDRDEIKDMKERLEKMEKHMDDCVHVQDEKIKEQNERIKEFTEKVQRLDTDLLTRYKDLQQIGFGGLELSLGGTFIVQGATNANSAVQDRDNVTDPTFSMDFVLNRNFLEVNGRGFFHFEAGKGLGVEEDILAYSNVNRDAFENDFNAKVTELYYEQFLLKDVLFFNAGLIDPTISFDNVTVANDETRFFIGRMFRNSPTIDFPDNSVGLRVNAVPVKWLDMSGAVMNANPAWNDLFSNLFGIGQINIMPELLGLEGNYRAYGWINGYNYTNWSDGSTGHSSYGFGISIDQKVAEPLTLFARYGWEDPKDFSPLVVNADGTPYSLEQAWSAGASLNGNWWKRDNDIFAIAFGQVFPSDDFVKANGFKDNPEIHLETYYSLVINRHIALTPDFQLVHNAFGGNSGLRNSNIYVFALRMQLDI